MVVILAINAALFFALHNIIIRIGLRHAGPRSAVLITQLTVLTTSLVAAMFATSLERLAGGAVLCFMAAGITGSLLARIFLFVAIDRVGASVTSTLYQIKPLFSAMAAVAILGEQITFSIAVATLMMMIGTAFISLEQAGGQIEKKWSKKDLAFPILAGVCFGVTHVFRKMGLNITPEPIAGVVVQSTTALTFFLCFSLVQKKGEWVGLNQKKTWFIIGLAGLCSFTAQLSIFSALDLGYVVIVIPLISLEPFFVLLLVRLFLKKLERITWKIVGGAVLIVGGAAVLSLLA